jgi:hypothetical protein
MFIRSCVRNKLRDLTGEVLLHNVDARRDQRIRPRYNVYNSLCV